MNLKEINIPDRYNYIAAFLTLECNHHCSYCINSFSGLKPSSKRIISSKDWVTILNRLKSRSDLPVTLQGGEPGLHQGFIDIINGIKEDTSIDILTNLNFDIDKFIKKVSPSRIRRDSPYPSIRASYHPECEDLPCFMSKVYRLHRAGFSIGVYMINYPWIEKNTVEIKKRCERLGILFKTKEFLGKYQDKVYGTYFLPEALDGRAKKRCFCRTSELLIGPGGDIFRCHHDLYKDFLPVGNLIDPGFEIKDVFRECNEFGDCNPCDVKLKTNRFQVFGHSSVEIRLSDNPLELVSQKEALP